MSTVLLYGWSDDDGDQVEVYRFTEPDIPEGSPIGEIATTSHGDGGRSTVVVVHIYKDHAMALRDAMNQMLAEAAH